MERVCWAILLVLCCAICFANGDGDEADIGIDTETSGAEFYAWLEHPEDVFEANLMQLRIRLFPNTTTFPGMETADVNRLDDTVVQVTVKLEDLSVPLWRSQIANRPQSHIIRERARGREAVAFCRRAILNASGLIVVAPRYTDRDRLLHGSVLLIDEAGDRVDLGRLLVKNGFAAVETVNWGRRLPE